MRRIINLLLIAVLIPSLCWAGIDFDGTDDLVDCGTADFLQENTPCTIFLLYYADALNNNARFVDRGTLHFYSASTTGFLTFSLEGTTALQRQSITGTIATGAWATILVTWDGSTTATNIHIYKNGTEVSYNDTFTQNGVGLTDTSGTSTIIGNRNVGDRPFNGRITEVAVWNVVLTAPQIALLANSKIKGIPLQIATANLKGYWPMDEVTHGASADLATLWDMSGNNNAGNPDNGAGNSGCLGSAETILSYPPKIIGD